MRTHVVIPEEIMAEVDRLVGRRQRSQFFTEAVREKIARARLAAAARRAAGSLADIQIPGWETSESAAAWVRASRRADDERLRRQQP